MLGKRQKRWPYIESTLCKRLLQNPANKSRRDAVEKARVMRFDKKCLIASDRQSGTCMHGEVVTHSIISRFPGQNYFPY